MCICDCFPQWCFKICPCLRVDPEEVESSSDSIVVPPAFLEHSLASTSSSSSSLAIGEQNQSSQIRFETVKVTVEQPPWKLKVQRLGLGFEFF